jgi:phage-related minor tail protein
MTPASNTPAALRTENSQLQEQLTAANKHASDLKDKLLASKDQLLAKNDALSALKDEIMALKIKHAEQCSTNGADVTAGFHSKRQCVASRSSVEAAAPLDKDELLDHVFGYEGGGDHFYVGGVSRRWRGRYM